MEQLPDLLSAAGYLLVVYGPGLYFAVASIRRQRRRHASDPVRRPSSRHEALRLVSVRSDPDTEPLTLARTHR